jgi:hypothetical protein
MWECPFQLFPWMVCGEIVRCLRHLWVDRVCRRVDQLVGLDVCLLGLCGRRCGRLHMWIVQVRSCVRWWKKPVLE